MNRQQGLRGPVLTLLSGTTVTMAVSFLAQPVLTRLYTPDDFGVLSYFMSLLGIVFTASTFQYDAAIVLPEEEDDAANLFWLCVALLAGWALLLAALIPLRTEIAGLLGFPGAAPWLPLLPAVLVAMRSGRLMETLLLRRRRFSVVSGGQVIDAVVAAGTRIGAGLPRVSAGPSGLTGASGLIGGVLAGDLAACLLYGAVIARERGRVLWRGLDLARLWSLAVRYRRFSLFSTPAALLNAVVTRLPFLAIPFFFDSRQGAILGFLGLAFNVFSVPLSSIRGSVAQAFLVQAAESNRAGRLREITEKVHARLVMTGLFPALVLVLAAPDLFDFVFGHEWREAGRYLQYIAPWIFLAFVASPLTMVFDVLERQRADLSTSLLMFGTLSAALVVGGLTGGIYATLFALGLCGAAARIVHIGVILRLAGLEWAAMFRPYVRFLLVSIPPLALIGAAMLFGRPWFTSLVVALAGLAYGLFVLRREGLLPARLHDRAPSRS